MLVCMRTATGAELQRARPGTAPELAYLELFCNPNSATNAFNAKVLVTAQTHDGVSVLTETPLTALKADLDLCREQNAVPA